MAQMHERVRLMGGLGAAIAVALIANSSQGAGLLEKGAQSKRSGLPLYVMVSTGAG